MVDCMQEKEKGLTLQDLPDELLHGIMGWMIADIDSSSRIRMQEEFAGTKRDALNRFFYIKRILPLNGVSRRLRSVVRPCIQHYLKEARTCVDAIGGADLVFYKEVAFQESFFFRSELAQLCLMLGVNINAAQYFSSDRVVSKKAGNVETLLTWMILQGDVYGVRHLLYLGADPMRPNAHGDLPIDLATSVGAGAPLIAQWIKENGGDPEGRHPYHKDVVRRGKEYGRKYGLALLKKKEQEACLRNPFMDNVQSAPIEESKIDLLIKNRRRLLFSAGGFGSVFCAGVGVGVFAHWAYCKWQKRKKAKEKRRQELVG